MKQTTSSSSPRPLVTVPNLRAELDRIILPELFCPFPSALNPAVEAVERHTNEWVRRFNLLPGEGAYRHFGAMRIGWLVARAYPNTALEQLQFLSDWTAWLFIQDDQCDELRIGKQPEELANIHAHFIDILSGMPPYNQDSPLAHALRDLRERIEPQASETCLLRFIHKVKEFFAGYFWEATNRANNIIPDVVTYMRMRLYTGGLYTYLELFEITEHLYLPLGVREHPTVQRLTQAALNAVCWTNDIFSLAKEMKQGDVHNLVLTLQHKHRLTLQEAIDRAAALHDAEVRTFINSELRLPSFGAAVDAELKRYVATLSSWMRGNVDWSYTSGRYLIAATVRAQ